VAAIAATSEALLILKLKGLWSAVCLIRTAKSIGSIRQVEETVEEAGFLWMNKVERLRNNASMKSAGIAYTG